MLNGTNLVDVLDAMINDGFKQGGHTYDDGPHVAVDWTNAALLQNAIAHGPVKIGVAANQLDKVISDPPKNGWFATGFQQDTNEDHCVSLCGYGTTKWLAQQLKFRVPTGVNSAKPGYAMFTWGSIGIIDVASLLAVTQEAWLRTPTTVILSA